MKPWTRFGVATRARRDIGCVGGRAQEQPDSVAVRSVPTYRAFGNPQRVTIRGYDGDAMEPFITKDGRFLLFNNRNDPRINTNLHFAARVEDLTFDYRGEIAGVNTAALEGVPSVDRSGHLFFISTRSYKETLSTLYRGRWNDGEVSDVRAGGGRLSAPARDGDVRRGNRRRTARRSSSWTAGLPAVTFPKPPTSRSRFATARPFSACRLRAAC